MKHEIKLKNGFYVPTSILKEPSLSQTQSFMLCVLLQLKKDGEKLDYTNKAFGKLFNLDMRSISRHLNILQELGYITLVFDLEKSEREIFITEKAIELQKGGN